MGQYLIIEDFRRGLDPRKFALGAPAGTLTDFINGHITNAGDIEKRKAFVSFANLDIDDDNGDQGLFGLQETAAGLTCFGSAGLNGSSPGQGQPELASDLPSTTPPLTYQQLKHPAILEGETYDRTKHRMVRVVWSELFGGQIQAVAEFVDGRRFGYKNGVLVEDYAAGLVLPHLAGDVTKLATHLTRQLNLSEDYTATQLTLTTTQRARAANVATLTLSSNPSAAGLVIGSKVRVAGVGGSGYNTSLATLTNVTSTTISYANNGGNEGATADTGGTVTSAIVTVTGAVGEEYDLTLSKESASGTITGPTNTVAAVKAVAGAAARGSFTITGGSDNGTTPTAATGTVTRTATNASDGDYILIGKKKYTFRATPSVEGDVAIGASAADSLTNLQRAINHTGTPGTDYVCALPHPWVRAGNISGSDLPLTAWKGRQGNSLALAESTGTVRFSVSGASFSGGNGNCIGSVKVVQNDGTEVELLSDAVRFQEDAATTAAAVRDNIVAFSGTSGYTAEVNENTVTILSSEAASPMPNGYHVQVAGGGDVLVGECLFYLTQQQSTFTINNVMVDGLDLFHATVNSGAIAFPTPPLDTFPELYAEIVSKINARSGATGINAWTNGEYVKLSRISTRDDDQPLVVYVNPATAGTVGVVFGQPPPLTLPLTVTVPAEAVAVGNPGLTQLQPSPGTTFAMVVTVQANVRGGNGAFTYEWLPEYPDLATGFVSQNTGIYGIQKAPYTITITPAGARAVAITFKAGPPVNNIRLNIDPTVIRYPVRVRVTDSFGNKATSDPCVVEYQIT